MNVAIPSLLTTINAAQRTLFLVSVPWAPYFLGIASSLVATEAKNSDKSEEA